MNHIRILQDRVQTLREPYGVSQDTVGTCYIWHGMSHVRSGHEYHSTTTYLEDSSKFLVER